MIISAFESKSRICIHVTISWCLKDVLDKNRFHFHSFSPFCVVLHFCNTKHSFHIYDDPEWIHYNTELTLLIWRYNFLCLNYTLGQIRVWIRKTYFLVKYLKKICHQICVYLCDQIYFFPKWQQNKQWSSWYI